MIEIIAEHSIDTSLLHPEANILDVGCRNWGFTRDMLNRGYNVCSVDIDKLEAPKEIKGYFNCAIGGKDCWVGILKNESDPQGTKKDETAEVKNIKMFTLESFTELVSKEIKPIKYWNVIKLDIEGAEYEAIMALNKAIARQFSIEFHLHTGIYGMKEVKEMEEKLHLLGYIAVQHSLTREHGLPENYWDSLWIFDWKNL